MTNREGYSDPTAERAIGNLTKEQKKQYMELKHGVKRGQIIAIKFMDRDEDRNCGVKEKICTYKVIDVYPHCILLEGENGVRRCPSWAQFDAMRKGREG